MLSTTRRVDDMIKKHKKRTRFFFGIDREREV